MHITKWKSQFEKAIYCMTPTIWYSRKSKAMETVKRSVVSGLVVRGNKQNKKKLKLAEEK